MVPLFFIQIFFYSFFLRFLAAYTEEFTDKINKLAEILGRFHRSYEKSPADIGTILTDTIELKELKNKWESNALRSDSALRTDEWAGLVRFYISSTPELLLDCVSLSKSFISKKEFFLLYLSGEQRKVTLFFLQTICVTLRICFSRRAIFC